MIMIEQQQGERKRMRKIKKQYIDGMQKQNCKIKIEKKKLQSEITSELQALFEIAVICLHVKLNEKMCIFRFL
jgi:hypothetical protein